MFKGSGCYAKSAINSTLFVTEKLRDMSLFIETLQTVNTMHFSSRRQENTLFNF